MPRYIVETEIKQIPVKYGGYSLTYIQTPTDYAIGRTGYSLSLYGDWYHEKVINAKIRRQKLPQDEGLFLGSFRRDTGERKLPLAIIRTLDQFDLPYVFELERAEREIHERADYILGSANPLQVQSVALSLFPKQSQIIVDVILIKS